MTHSPSRQIVFLAWMLGLALFVLRGTPAWGAVNVLLTDVPDYTWYAGCFGTASGNLMGYWDRHGFPNFYTGPTAGGVAPLDSNGANVGIRSLWASRAGFDGRPAGKLGHIDDYWLYYNDDQFYSYESTVPDPYLTAGRPEHSPDCLGDFIGLSQNKWTNLNGECNGNIDAFSFVFWEPGGKIRWNYTPASPEGQPIPDIPSGLRAWTRFRGSDADVFSQLADFNPTVTASQGFTFDMFRAEIDAGYPVLFYLQDATKLFRDLPGMAHANPEIHGIIGYGYYITDTGVEYARFKTSWGSSGDNSLSRWGSQSWLAQLPVRGIIGYHPRPRITGSTATSQGLRLEWEGPSSVISNVVEQTATPLHWYVVEKANSLHSADFEPVTSPTLDHSATVPDCCGEGISFLRIKLIPPPTQ